MANWQRKGVSDKEWELLLEQERLKGLVADALAQALQQTGMTKAEFAKSLGVSQARVSQILSGAENLTLESLASVSLPLGLTWNIQLSKQVVWSLEQPDEQLREARVQLARWVVQSEETEHELFSVLAGSTKGERAIHERTASTRVSSKHWEKVAL
jgi:transcriptional regulator with XRE-family HTH domain